MKSLTLKAENSLLEFLQENLKDYLVNNKKLTIKKGYIKEETLRESISSESKTNEYPLLLLRRGKFNQTLNDGIAEKKQEFILFLAIKEGIKEGYEIIQEFGEEVLDLLNINPFTLAGFALEQGIFSGGISNEQSGGDNWLYEIRLALIIPVLETRDKGGEYN